MVSKDLTKIAGFAIAAFVGLEILKRSAGDIATGIGGAVGGAATGTVDFLGSTAVNIAQGIAGGAGLVIGGILEAGAELLPGGPNPTQPSDYTIIGIDVPAQIPVETAIAGGVDIRQAPAQVVADIAAFAASIGIAAPLGAQSISLQADAGAGLPDFKSISDPIERLLAMAAYDRVSPDRDQVFTTTQLEKYPGELFDGRRTSGDLFNLLFAGPVQDDLEETFKQQFREKIEGFAAGETGELTPQTFTIKLFSSTGVLQDITLQRLAGDIQL